jgi:glycosyltransferase involved in cell wall biosynthesis
MSANVPKSAKHKKPVKVLHIADLDKENYFLNNLCDHTDAAEIDYSFITFAGELSFSASLAGRGKRVYCLNARTRAAYPRAARKIWRIQQSDAPDIVHTHFVEPSLIGLSIAKLQGRKTVVTRHHSDAIHAIDSSIKRRVFLFLDAMISRMADHMIAPSRMVRDVLVETEGVAEEKVSVIPYGQTMERFDAVTPDKVRGVRDELNMTSDFSLVCVSRLYHRKGHKYLFEALASNGLRDLDWTLYLVGDGDFRDTLEAMCRDLDIAERVRFLGWRDDVLTVIAAADVVVHPSLEDALSSAVIESLMLARPIIASDISGVRDSLGDGKFGRIVPPADAAVFRTALCEVLADLPSAREKARLGRDHLLNYMDARRVADAYRAIYKKLVD